MAKPYKEKELREQYPDFDEKLVSLLNQGGQQFAAFQLGTSQSTISSIVKRSGYIEKITFYRLKEQPA